MTGPVTRFGEATHAKKYRGRNETFKEYAVRVADALSDGEDHFEQVREILEEQRFLPGGRIQSSIGAPRVTTAYNCFVSPIIYDCMEGIMDVAKYAALTMRLGGGIGYDFSTLRPRGGHIVTLDSCASGPVSFMDIFDAVCKTISSAGNRRGAQMGVLRVDHPDIEEFIDAKSNEYKLKRFNLSVGITDEFMYAVEKDLDFNLRFEGKVYKVVKARKLWDKIMRNTWDWAEPGVLFLDRIAEMNNLNYAEHISATNPCGEQPLPPNGACLLGSFNLVKYLEALPDGRREFNYSRFMVDIPPIIRAMDNVIDRTVYPLPAQEAESKAKRRMGIGVTGVANAIEALGYPYGSPGFLIELEHILETLAETAYQASAILAHEKGPFPAYKAEQYRKSNYLKVLSDETRDLIDEFGIRNSHLLSIAPTGTISIAADNVSSGIEPVYSRSYERVVESEEGAFTETVDDYGVKFLGTNPKTANECTVEEHLSVLLLAQRWVDSAVSKTINVGDGVTWEEFKDIYHTAWANGAKGCTTFRAAGKRYGILKSLDKEADDEPKACYYDETTGQKECS